MAFFGKKSKKHERDLMCKLGIDQKTFKDIQITFNMLDKDGSGSISHQEFKDIMTKHRCRSTDQEIENMIVKADRDNNGAIEFEEFAEMMAMKHRQNSLLEKEIRETFTKFDQNKDGKVCRKELQWGMQSMGAKLTDAEADEIIRSADKDGDGALNFKEFAQYVIDNQ